MPADFGLKLLAKGITLGSKVYVANIVIAELSVTGNAAYQSTVEYSYQRTVYLARLRYNPDSLKLLLTKADPGIRNALLQELSADPLTPRTLAVAPPVKTNIIARLLKPSDAAKTDRERYAPLEIISVE